MRKTNIRHLRITDPKVLQETLELLAEGLTTAEMAKRLEISQDGVKSRVSAVLYRMRARNRAHAVALGFQRRLLNPASTPKPQQPRQPRT
ncbi:MAG: hypothetical protein HOV94_05655 [Saccharothrix sp.]|nr:hypothetical protein [Saccharothrix sp.]